LLVHKRYRKLYEEFWDAKRGSWNISKVPEIYDAVRYDLIHHPKLDTGFASLFSIAERLNDKIVPAEYGHDLPSKLLIGSTVCKALLKKLLGDLRYCVGGSSRNTELPEKKIVTAVQYLKRFFGYGQGPKPAVRVGEDTPTPTAECVKEAEHASLDPSYASLADIKSAHRRVRTRLYFTSESHIQALMNVLRYCHVDLGSADGLHTGSGSEENAQAAVAGSVDGIVCADAEQHLNSKPVFDYLTQIVFRLYEDKEAPLTSPERHCVEVLFSPGAAGDPLTMCGPGHAMPLKELRPLHTLDRPLTLARLQELLKPFAETNLRKPTAGASRGREDDAPVNKSD